MILSGHLAAGYLASIIVIRTLKPELDPAHLNYLIILGTFFGMIPDLDAFWVFYKNKRFTFSDESINHRDFPSHAPSLWTITGLALFSIFAFLNNEFMKYASLVLIISVLSHFILDSIQIGIMWLWPLSKKRYAIEDEDIKNIIHRKYFFGYWIKFVEVYATNIRATFWAEVVLTILGLIIFVT